MVNQWLQSIHCWVYPSRCVLCHQPAEESLALCEPCRRDLPRNTSACIRCALPLPAESLSVCGRCLAKPPPYHKARAPYLYQPPADHLIQTLKFQKRLAYARVIAELLVRDLIAGGDPLPELIIPVPLHIKRLRQRGFNQSLEIARLLAKSLSIPIDHVSCIRSRATAMQSGLAAKARRANIRGAFNLRRPVRAKHVAVVDDVMTTGNTVAELTNTLRKRGVATVEVWAFARATLETPRR